MMLFTIIIDCVHCQLKDLKRDLQTFLQLLHSLLLAVAQLSAPLWKWKHIKHYVMKSRVTGMPYFVCQLLELLFACCCVLASK